MAKAKSTEKKAGAEKEEKPAKKPAAKAKAPAEDSDIAAKISVSPERKDAAEEHSASVASPAQVTEPTLHERQAMQDQGGEEAPISVRTNRPLPKYGDEDLAEFRKVIDAAREEAMEELRMLRERLDDLNSSDTMEESAIYSMHMAEQGSEAQEKEKTYAQIQRINDYIHKLDEAMQRIENKTYGVCRECGILIAKERLLAVPITTLSASFKLRKQCPEDGIDRIMPLKK